MTELKRNKFLSLLQDITSDLFHHRPQIRTHASILYAAIKPHQVLNIYFIFIYSSLPNIWNSEELAPTFPSKIIQTERYAHTVNLTHPVVGSYITLLVRLIHPGHTSAPTYVLSKHSAQPIDHMLDTVDLTLLQLRECVLWIWSVCMLLLKYYTDSSHVQFLQLPTTRCWTVRNPASMIQKRGKAIGSLSKGESLAQSSGKGQCVYLRIFKSVTIWLSLWTPIKL